MKRKIGDLYRVVMDDGYVAHFQHVVDDSTQLGSNVICVFKHRYPKDASLSSTDIANDRPEFHAHVAIPVGIKHNCWTKIGFAPVQQKPVVLFRICNDYGPPPPTTSKDWSVWRANEPLRRVGKLTGDLRDAEIGLIVNPFSLVFRIRNGHYDFAYPEA